MSPGTSTRHRSAKAMFQVIKNRFLLFDYYKEIPNAADFFNYYWLFGCSKSDPVQVYIRHPKLKQHAMLTAFLSWRLDESCCSGLNPELTMKGACSARVQSCVGRSLWNAEPGANTEGSQWFNYFQCFICLIKIFLLHETHFDFFAAGDNGTRVSLAAWFGGNHGGEIAQSKRVTFTLF